MGKLTECLIVLAFLLCAFTAQAASEIDVSVPSAGEPCTNDLQCDPGELCIKDICSVTRPCTSDLQCDPGEFCIDDICKEGECVNDEDCEEGLICLANKCVECLTWNDCGEGDICSVENMCMLADDCDLKIKGKMVINKNKKTTYKVAKIRIKGNENFYPFKTNPDSGILEWNFEITPLFQTATTNRWYNKRRVLEIAAGVNIDVASGIYTVQLGTCLGQVEVINLNE